MDQPATINFHTFVFVGFFIITLGITTYENGARTSKWYRLAGVGVSSDSATETAPRSRSVLQCAATCRDAIGCVEFCYHATSCSCYLNGLTTSTNSSATLYENVDCFTLCPGHQGYDIHGLRCMKLFPDPLTYTAARDRCSAEGAHIYHLKSLTLDRPPFLQLLDSHGLPHNGHYWMGANAIGTERAFRWTDGTALPDAADVWFDGEPNNQGGNEECVRTRSTAYLIDSDCDKVYAFVCEIDI